MLADALLSDEHIIRAEVEQGICELWKVEGYGYFVTRLESNGVSTELVLVAWQGKNTQPLIEHLINVCKNIGVKTMRFHTVHNKHLISRFVKKWGFTIAEIRESETVYRAKV